MDPSRQAAFWHFAPVSQLEANAFFDRFRRWIEHLDDSFPPNNNPEGTKP